jgi:hypothetical protein
LLRLLQSEYFLKFDGFIFFSISLLILVLAQKLLQREIQIILLLLTKNPNLAIGIFSLLLLPGVFIHEVSHLLMAIVLRVPVRKISLIPQVNKKGNIRLGYVETTKSDFLRDSLIGLAPFITGLLILTYIGTKKLGLVNIGEIPNFRVLLENLIYMPKTLDFGLWIYFAFAISTTMLPSESDRQSWKIIIIVIGTILGLVLVSGYGEWMTDNIYPFLNQWLLSISIILFISIIIHLIIYFPSTFIRHLISKFTGLTVG